MDLHPVHDYDIYQYLVENDYWKLDLDFSRKEDIHLGRYRRKNNIKLNRCMEKEQDLKNYLYQNENTVCHFWY